MFYYKYYYICTELSPLLPLSLTTLAMPSSEPRAHLRVPKHLWQLLLPKTLSLPRHHTIKTHISHVSHPHIHTHWHTHSYSHTHWHAHPCSEWRAKSGLSTVNTHPVSILISYRHPHRHTHRPIHADPYTAHTHVGSHHLLHSRALHHHRIHRAHSALGLGIVYWRRLVRHYEVGSIAHRST